MHRLLLLLLPLLGTSVSARVQSALHHETRLRTFEVVCGSVVEASLLRVLSSGVCLVILRIDAYVVILDSERGNFKLFGLIY